MGSATKQGELWGQAPSDWALLQETLHRPLFEAMLNASHVDKNIRILDAGCGGGNASILADERGAIVSGLDASEGLINVARERLLSADFRIGDMQTLPYEDNTFDVVIAPNSVQFTDNHLTSLRELKRVCKPGGYVVVALLGSPEKVEFGKVLKALGSVMPAPPKNGGPFALSMDGKLEQLIEQAGLTIVDSSEINCPFIYADFETFWKANSAAGPVQGMMQVVSAEKLKSTLKQCAEQYTLADGRIEIAPNMFKYVVTTA